MPGIRVGRRDDHPGDTAPEDRVGAGRGAPVGGTGFQRDVESGAPDVVPVRPGVTEGLDLGVGMTGAAMPAPTDDLRSAGEDGADERVRRGLPRRLPGEAQGFPEMAQVDGFVPGHGGGRVGRIRSGRETGRVGPEWPCGVVPAGVQCRAMAKKAKKKRVARPRVLWQVNPSTRVEPSAKQYSRRTRKKPRTAADDEQEN